MKNKNQTVDVSVCLCYLYGTIYALKIKELLKLIQYYISIKRGPKYGLGAEVISRGSQGVGPPC